MNNIFKKFTILFIGMSFLLGSCDELNKLDLNIPLDIFITSKGTNTTVTEKEFFCLSQYQDWRDNQDDIESVKYLEASYWTKSASPNLRGDITVALYAGTNTPLFSYTFFNVKADDFIGKARKIELNENQIKAVDNVLSNLAGMDACFTTELTVSNITGDKNSSGQYELNGQVTIVLATEVKTN